MTDLSRRRLIGGLLATPVAVATSHLLPMAADFRWVEQATLPCSFPPLPYKDPIAVHKALLAAFAETTEACAAMVFNAELLPST